MTSLNKQKIFEKIDSLNQYLKYLDQLQQESDDSKKFISDFHLFGNVERYLQLAIQSISDIGHLIILDLGLEKPQDNYEAVSLLFSQGIITQEAADCLTKMIGLRNILVHEYGRIDREKIYDILHNQLKDIENIKEQIIVYLKK